MKSDMLKLIHQEIIRHRNIVFISHIFPEGDALGSQLGLYHLMKARTRRIHLLNRDHVPSNLKILPGFDRIRREPPAGPVTLAVILDCADRVRLGQLWDYIKTIPVRIVLDHHVQSDSLADLQYIDRQACSTGEIVYDFAVTNKLPISTAAAINLYAAILTDTGSFRYSNTSAATMFKAARLVEIGKIAVNKLNRFIYAHNSIEKLRLHGRVLSTLEMTDTLVVGTITRAMVKETGANWEDAESIAEVVQTIGGLAYAIMFWEMDDDTIRVQLRSPTGQNVLRLAAMFGGGGHPTSAGFNVRGQPLKTIRKKVLAAANKLLRNQ